MEQKRLIFAIAISIAILLGFQLFISPHLPHPPVPAAEKTAAATPAASPASGNAGASLPAAGAAAVAATPAPRLPIDAASLRGSIDLRGAMIDDLWLRDYRETLAKNSPEVRLLEPRSDAQPYFVQYGWSAAPGERVVVPDDNTVWTASAPRLTSATPVTLSWTNPQGVTFQLLLTVDENYMFGVTQKVLNASGHSVKLFPWARVRRDYTPPTTGSYELFEGLLGVVKGTLQETTYAKARSEGKEHDGLAYDATATGGWAGITDKYWLTAVIPDQNEDATVSFRHIAEKGDHYQVDYLGRTPQTIAPGGDAIVASHMFAGAKIVHLLDQYEAQYHIPNFDKAVDFGWFYFLTKPIFLALDWLNSLLGNFGLAIMVFTVCVKALFFPLANYSYRSMSKMRLLAPKVKAMRERLKDDPGKMQSEMMALYKSEKVNPASGCLPMVVQIPVFFSLYKVIYTTIEMRQAPFIGWIHDLSAVDPTNVFNLFGLIPFDPTAISPLLHMGIWPLIMGCTMFLQQRLNPPPPDPMQARMFMLMPIVFTFMMARFPAGLVIYWSWNNTLSILQQWVIMRRTRLSRPGLAR